MPSLVLEAVKMGAKDGDCKELLRLVTVGWEPWPCKFSGAKASQEPWFLIKQTYKSLWDTLETCHGVRRKEHSSYSAWCGYHFYYTLAVRFLLVINLSKPQCAHL